MFFLQCHKINQAHKAVITMRLMHTRPFLWAMGTNFNPYFEDANQIAIQIDIDEDGQWEKYESLVSWLLAIVPLGGEDLTDEEADLFWQKMTL
jgi:hypothetical protein